jgi:CO dehydrogenase nickel-insertion accessory protein CooC1
MVKTIGNKVQSEDMDSILRSEFKKRKIELLGRVRFDDEVISAGLLGKRMGDCRASEDMKMILTDLAELL